MIKPQLFKHTTDVLFSAYFTNTLKHGDFCGCAVGNLIAAAMSIKVVPEITIEHDGLFGSALGWESWEPLWDRVFFTGACDIQEINMEEYVDFAKMQIDATGYSVEQLAKIEHAFETAKEGENDEDFMFNGLTAVLDVLKHIHQATDDDLLPETMRFRNHYETLIA